MTSRGEERKSQGKGASKKKQHREGKKKRGGKKGPDRDSRGKVEATLPTLESTHQMSELFN